MTKPSLRQSILLKSVQRLLDDGEQVQVAVMLSTRHRWFVPYALASGLVLFLVATATGIGDSMSRLVIGLCGMAIASLATTNSSVLAETTAGLVLLRSSRVRQYATALTRRFPATTSVDMVASTVISSDWRIDGVIYSTTKRWEAALRELAGRHS